VVSVQATKGLNLKFRISYGPFQGWILPGIFLRAEKRPYLTIKMSNINFFVKFVLGSNTSFKILNFFSLNTLFYCPTIKDRDLRLLQMKEVTKRLISIRLKDMLLTAPSCNGCYYWNYLASILTRSIIWSRYSGNKNWLWRNWHSSKRCHDCIILCKI
jgi:hypothetical protein